MKRRTMKTLLLIALISRTTVDANIAWHMAAEQDSTCYGKGAELAVDGNRDQNWMRGSCTQTHETASPWWMADLATEHLVVQVRITNRLDCCKQRLHDFTIGVTNTRPTTTAGPDKLQHQVCLHYNGDFPATTLMLNCTANARGRYLFIQIPGDKEILTLCEVEVFSDANIARGKAAAQESTGYGKGPELAVDGNRDQNWSRGSSCTQTKETANPWWMVDLAAEHPVVQVRITNRLDCCSERLHDFTIGVTNTRPTTTAGPDTLQHQVCLHYNGAFPATAVMLNCTAIARGRYLFIQILGDKESLTFCEVEVFSAVAIATGHRDFGDCAVFNDHKRSTCDVVTSATNPLDFVLRMSLLQSQTKFNVSVTLRDGDCGDNGQVHVYTEMRPLFDMFNGYYRRCHLAETASAAVDGATVCMFRCLCTNRPCDFVFVRVFGRYGPVRSLCEVELL